MTNKKNGTLYIGVTSDLIKRIYQHRNDYFEGFSKRYGTKILVYYELHDSMENAILRETQMKAWKRQWKVELIQQENPHWKDLYPHII